MYWSSMCDDDREDDRELDRDGEGEWIGAGAGAGVGVRDVMLLLDDERVSEEWLRYSWNDGESGEWLSRSW